MATETIDNCQLEIDSERGVIYVHSGSTGWTLLRIANLPTPIPPRDYKPGTHQAPMLDIYCGSRPQYSWHGERPAIRDTTGEPEAGKALRKLAEKQPK